MISPEHAGTVAGAAVSVVILKEVFTFVKWLVDRINGKEKDAEIKAALKDLTKVLDKIGYWLHDLKNGSTAQSGYLKELDSRMEDHTKVLSEIKKDGEQTGKMVEEIRKGMGDLNLKVAVRNG